MKYNEDVINFWKNDDFKNITPRGKEFPEGWDVRTLLTTLVGDEDIIEVGCGYGRLVEAFKPEQYIGVDINPNGVMEAKERNPKYTFKDFNVDDQLDVSSWLMFYTVLLHVNDDDILPYLQSVTKNTDKVLVAEILGQKWRGNFKYAFNREESEYEDIFEKCGFRKQARYERDYEHYANTAITFLVFEKNK